MVISANSHVLDGLAAGVGSTDIIGSKLVLDGKRGRAHKSAVFLSGRGLKGTLGISGATSGQIGGAFLHGGARRSAEGTRDILDGDVDFIRKTFLQIGIAIMGLGGLNANGGVDQMKVVSRHSKGGKDNAEGNKS